MLYVNGIRAMSIRLYMPWSGAWTIEADLDPDTPAVPSGPAIVKIGVAGQLVGAVDPNGSGRFGERMRIRIVGGGGGWHRSVSARQFHNDAGVFTTAVITATAAEIGERAVVPIPKRLGVDFLRTAGPASRVLAGLDWYVDLTGATIVAPRVPTPAVPGSIDVLTYDPNQQAAELASDAVILPGTILVDTRFGTITVRDVEQTFTEAGARATAWCASKASPTPGGKLVTLIASVVRETARTDTLRTYRYRVVSQGPDGRLSLQSITRTIGVPDSIALPPWYGLPGVSALIVPGTEAAVVFLNGDYAQPAVVSFKGKATQIKIGDAPQPVALAPLVASQLAALKSAIAAAPVVAGDGGASFKAALVAALTSWPAPVASSKLSSD